MNKTLIIKILQLIGWICALVFIFMVPEFSVFVLIFVIGSLIWKKTKDIPVITYKRRRKK